MFTIALVFAAAACQSDNADPDAGSSDIKITFSSSDSDISELDSLKDIPAYAGIGTVEYPWEGDTSGFWVSGSGMIDMKNYGDVLEANGWIPDRSAVDYDPDLKIYYRSADSERMIQLKLMDDIFIRVTVGTPDKVNGLD